MYIFAAIQKMGGWSKISASHGEFPEAPHPRKWNDKKVGRIWRRGKQFSASLGTGVYI